MRKFIMVLIIILMTFTVSGCFQETVTKDTEGNTKNEFSIGETAVVNNTKITINSVKKIEKECLFEYDGKCESYNKPDGDYFLVIDITIENIGEEEMSISSLMQFELKNSSGEKADQSVTLQAVKSSLDGNVMAHDILKGQLGYDVTDSEYYYLYYQDSLLDDSIKIKINKTDIVE